MKWVVLLMLLAAAPLCAKCVVPLGFKGHARESREQAVIVYRAPTDDASGYEELFIKVSPELDLETAKSMALVIPLPGPALRHDVVDGSVLANGRQLHDALFELARRQWDEKTGFALPSWLDDSQEHKDDQPGLPAPKQGEPVGSHLVTVIPGKGAAATAALKQHLRKYGLQFDDLMDTAYYDYNDFTYLCVQFFPLSGKASLGNRPELPVVAVGFETDKLYYPAKCSGKMGNFILDMTVITDKPIESDALGEARMELNATNHGYVQLLNLYTLKPLPQDLAAALGDRARADDPAHWYINRIESDGANPDDSNGVPALAKREQELFIPLGDVTDELPGFWYYGDQDITFPERFFREHALALFVTIGVVFFVTLFIKTRFNRKRYLAELKARGESADAE